MLPSPSTEFRSAGGPGNHMIALLFLKLSSVNELQQRISQYLEYKVSKSRRVLKLYPTRPKNLLLYRPSRAALGL